MKSAPTHHEISPGTNCPGRRSDIDDPNWAKSTSDGGAPKRAMPTMEAAGPHGFSADFWHPK